MTETEEGVSKVKMQAPWDGEPQGASPLWSSKLWQKALDIIIIILKY